MAREYRTKGGKLQIMPSLEEVRSMIDEQEGWCLACGSTQPGVEPDARRYTCECCGEPKVYGAEELVLMGLVD